MKPIEIDGRTGEGGGQLVRNAIALAASISQPVKITNVRGNRPGTRNRGQWLPNCLILKRMTKPRLRANETHQVLSLSTLLQSSG